MLYSCTHTATEGIKWYNNVYYPRIYYLNRYYKTHTTQPAVNWCWQAIYFQRYIHKIKEENNIHI